MRLVLSLLTMSLLSATPSAVAQRSVGCFIAGQEVDPCHCARTCASRPSGPSREELERRRKEQEEKRAAESMHDANDRGVDAFRRRDWAAAIEYFRQAIQASPDDPDILHNLKRAREEQAKERGRTQPAAAPAGPQPASPVPVAVAATRADERVAQLAKISESLSRFVSEYQPNPASTVLAQRGNIEAALKILATHWIVGAPAAHEELVKKIENQLRSELEKTLKASLDAMLIDIKRIQRFDHDSPARAAQKRDVVRQTVEEINRLRKQASTEASRLETTADKGSYQIRFNSGPALRELESINRTGKWRSYDAG